MFRTLFKTLPSALAFGGLMLGAAAVQAADHLDAPAAAADPAADINDLYVFRSTDAENNAGSPRTVFVLTVSPLADATSRFSDAVEYRFHIRDIDNAVSHLITCTADDSAVQNITCAVPGGATDTVAFGDTTDGDRAANPDVISYAGLNDDPFFFDLADFQAVYQSVLDGSPDPSPLLDAEGEDFFAGVNTLTIVVDVDNAIFGNATTLGVWASTTRIGN